mmetsp:Transcript_4846/g.11646  ORF Transcript_4846/g.11646 Transcript_4846/m.11646 type:complete len:780 (-) Transcript_4846:56-2395(-)
MTENHEPPQETHLIGDILTDLDDDSDDPLEVAQRLRMGEHRGGAKSAPPAFVVSDFTIGPSTGLEGSEDGMADSWRASAEYYTYYYSHRPLDHRLPPPLFQPQWSAPNGRSLPSSDPVTTAFADGGFLGEAGAFAEGAFSVGNTPSDTPTNAELPQSPNKPRSVVQMIQEDFPRTPSPVFTTTKNQANAARRAQSKLVNLTSGTGAEGMEATQTITAMQQLQQLQAQQMQLLQQQQAQLLAQQQAMQQRQLQLQPPFAAAQVQQLQALQQQQQQMQLQVIQQQRALQMQMMQQRILLQQQEGSGLDGASLLDAGMQHLSLELGPRGQRNGTAPNARPFESNASESFAGNGRGGRGAGRGAFGMSGLPSGFGGQQAAPFWEGDGNRGRGGNTGRGGWGNAEAPARGRDAKAGNKTGEGVRSPLLEEFRMNKNRRLELSDISGHAVEFSQDQHGSRFIQTKLETATEEEKSMVFDELRPQMPRHMTDVFGNYVVQKFLERGNAEQRAELAAQMKGHVLFLSLQMYGCRVVQKSLDVLSPEQQAPLVKELDGHVMRCVKDQNGNHVIQKCIEKVAAPDIQFIVDYFVGQVVPLATHPYGCRVIQRILEHCQSAQQMPVLEEIVAHTSELVHDQYGNYVVQHVLDHGTQAHRDAIVAQVAGRVFAMSQHKFASNVVEKVFQHATQEQLPSLVEELVKDSGSGLSPIHHMMRDQYGNYVVQKALDVCRGPLLDTLVSCIREQLPALRKFTYGKHILSYIEKMGPGGTPVSPNELGLSSPPLETM